MKVILTSHAKDRIEKRGLLREEIIYAIKHPDKMVKKYDKYYAQKNIGRGTIEVVYEKKEKYLKVITVYWI